MSEIKEKNSKNNSLIFKKYLNGLLLKVLLIAVSAWVLCTYVFGIFVCHSNDNFPSLKDGDLCITYKMSDYYVNDLVAYEHDGKIYFGRIVGTNGDTVDGNEYGFTVNNVIPYESVFYNTVFSKDDKLSYPYSVKEGEVFILADMRTDGKDTRTFGTITLKELRGKVVLQLRRRGF